MNTHKNMLLATAISTAMLTGCASAQGYNSRHAPTQNNQGFYTTVDVVGVQPNYTTVQVPTDYQDCRVEPVQHHVHNRSHYGGGYNSYTPHILGGLVGGVIGNQFGKGSGKDALTVAGAVLGASIGRDQANRPHSYRDRGHTYTTNERRCVTRTSYHEERQLDGYTVTYQYHGRNYTTWSAQHPGQRMRVRIDVTPAGDVY